MFIGGLSWQTTTEGLKEYFGKFGNLKFEKKNRSKGEFLKKFWKMFENMAKEIKLSKFTKMLVKY